MSTPIPGRKRLPVKPSEEHLRKQAKRRAKTDSISLADAQHRLAVEYGSRNWAELLHVVEVMNRGADQLANVKREVEPLPAAVRKRDEALVREILSSGQFTQHDLDAGLAHSAWYGGDAADVLPVRKRLFDLLLDHGADPDGQYGSGYGPIVFGTGECLDPDGLQWLIDAGADVTFPPLDTKYGKQCPLSHWLGTYARGANDKKHRGIEMLLKHNAFIPVEVNPPILAIHRGDAQGLARLLDEDPALIKKTFPDMPWGNVHLAGATLLHCAVEFDEIDCCDVLLDRYADINAKAQIIDGVGGQTPIFHLLNTGWASHLATLEHLLKRAGQWIDLSIRATWRTWEGPRKNPATALEYAEEPGDAKWRKNRAEEIALLQSLDARGQIIKACQRGDVATVSEMLDKAPSLLTGELWPPTVYQAKSLELTRHLLQRGLDPNISSAPRRALDLAAYLGLADIAELLLSHGASATTRNKLGETPMDLLDAYEPKPIGDPETNRLRKALIDAGAPYDLQAAVRAGDIDAVTKMLDANPDQIRGAEPLGPWPPLFTAARSGRVEVAKLLLVRGADVNQRNAKGNTPLWFACQSPANAADRIAVAKLLIDAGAHVRAECEDRTTPLHFAAWRGPLEMVELLLRNGAREWQQDRQGQRPLDHARRGNAIDKEKIIELLDRPVIREPIFRQAVNAIQSGDLPALKQLLAANPNLIHDAAIEPDCYPPSYFHSPKLLWFIADNPNLMQTMPANITEITAALIDAGADQPDLDYTLELVMTSAPARVQSHQKPLMQLLLARGAKPSEATLNSTLGHWETDAVKSLLDAGFPLSAPIAAALGMTTELPQLLVKSNPDQLHAAFSLAVINRQKVAAKICLEAGANVDQPLIVHAHSMPLHQAAVNDDIEMLKLLVAHGANLNARDTLWNGTPLGWAVHEKKPAAEAYLKSIGAP